MSDLTAIAIRLFVSDAELVKQQLRWLDNNPATNSALGTLLFCLVISLPYLITVLWFRAKDAAAD